MPLAQSPLARVNDKGGQGLTPSLMKALESYGSFVSFLERPFSRTTIGEMSSRLPMVL
jgi:hypothetical protein